MKKLKIIPVGDSEELRKFAELLRFDLQTLTSMRVRLLKPRPSREAYYTKHRTRDQFIAFSIVKAELRKQEKDVGVLVLVDVPIGSPGHSNMFGQADSVTKRCIVSINPLRHSSSTKWYRRALITSIHEIWHLRGFGHCKRKDCVMLFSSTVEDTDRKGPDICNGCLRREKAA